MPLFISDEEFRQCSGDAGLVAEKADAFIRELYCKVETVKAEADAASITLEQTSSFIEQKYVSLSAEYSSLQSQHSELNSSFEQRNSEFAKLQSEKQHLLLQSIEKDGEIERLSREAVELHKSKRQLMELVEQKDLEVSEKNATIKSYLDKIVNLTENAASKEAHLGAVESELGRSQAASARLLQEKELLERHNKWLNEELTTKVDSLIQLRKANGELEADMSSKLADVEKKFKESSSSLKFQKDRIKELEEMLASMERELLSTKDASSAAEEHLSTEIATLTRLVDLYKESSEEWSKKATELEGVIKALETHLNQVENDYKEKLEKEVSARKEVEKESGDLREKLETSKAEVENLKKENEQKNLPLSSYTTDSWLNSVATEEVVEDDRAIVPVIAAGVSGTALAASLLRDGWTLAKIYVKYHEAVDAFRHEQQGRKHSQAILERVLYEIEEKSGVIMEEREEHERLLEAYSGLDEKLQHSLSEHSVLETTILELKASLKRQERDYAVAEKEIVDLQKQVTILLKECRDVQLRCGSVGHYDAELVTGHSVQLNAESNAQDIISEQQLTFKDINGLVEQNVLLRRLVDKLSGQIDEKEKELKGKYAKELQKNTDEAVSKVNAVLQRAEEQAEMIESLHSSVAMYKKLYEEEHKRRSYPTHLEAAVEEPASREVMLLHEDSHETSGKVQEKALERLKNLEEDLMKSRNDIISVRAERDKLALETRFAQEKLARYMKEFEHQREEHNGVLSRNVEFSQMIVDYQKQLRDSAESVNAANELSRKLTMEVSILNHEKEMLQNSENKASDEIRSLSERVHRLQASLDTIQSTEEVREEARGIERRKQEEYINKIEREWAEAKRELQEERDNVRNLTLERESTLKDALRQVEELRKELAHAVQSLAAAESRAAVAEARCSDFEKIMEASRMKNPDGAEGGSSSSTERMLANFRDEIEKLRLEAQASKDHMLQYKSIALVNEEALKQMELAHENLRNEANEVKKLQEDELHSLRERVKELESECKLKTDEAISATAGKEEALAGAFSEIASLKNDCAVKMSEIVVMESKMSALREDLDKEHQKWRTAQDHYERQVILQSETIQELTKTSQALGSAQEEISELHKVMDELKIENINLKSKWETEKLSIDVYKNEADMKYNEVNELNKILHDRLEALHIKLAEKERGIASGSGPQNFADDDGLQNIVNYLRRSKEIAQTEISLLKQEKLRLQAQLEVALKSAEAAQTSLHTERTKSQASLLNEEDFKSLKLQVRELTLLRESNAQLREENRHNFEECQKLREAFQNARTETENLGKLVKERDTELEAHRKEIETLQSEKMQLQKRINELVEKCRDVDVDDYNRLKESFEPMQAHIREKDAELKEIKKLLSEKQDELSQLEQHLATSRSELDERERRINELLQAEASLKSDIEKVRRLNVQLRRKNDNLSKEKEDLNKEVQALSKQLEDAKQVKRTTLDSAGELAAVREKEKEKDTRIQILERTLERHREDLKKEKEDHHKEKEKSQKIRKTIIEHRDMVSRQRTKFSDELKKHKQALRTIQDEVEKLKNSGGGQSENTSTVQDISSPLLEDFASAYFQAVENFEQVSQPACGEPDSTTSDAPSLDTTSSAQTQTSTLPVTNVPITRTNEEKERRLALGKANVKTGRKLVRPNIIKPKEPQADVEMSEADESNTGMTSQSIESQGNVTAATSLVRKRPSSSLSADLQEEMPTPEETSPDTQPPLLKKSKPSESTQDGGEEVSAAPVKLSETTDVEGTPEDVEGIQQGMNKDEPDDVEEDETEAAGEQVEEPVVDEQIPDETEPGEIPDEKLEKPSDSVLSDEQLRDQTEQDIQQIVTESGGDREEGEMVADTPDNDGENSISNEMGGPGVGEDQSEQPVEPENSPSTEHHASASLEAGEIDPSQTPDEEKNSDTNDNIDDGADPIAETKSPGPSTAITDTVTSSTSVDVESSDQGSATPDAGAKAVSPLNSSSTTINLQERARLRARQRQIGMASTTPTRGAVRAVRGAPRGRTAPGRGAPRGRTAPGRGQSPG